MDYIKPEFEEMLRENHQQFQQQKEENKIIRLEEM